MGDLEVTRRSFTMGLVGAGALLLAPSAVGSAAAAEPVSSRGKTSNANPSAQGPWGREAVAAYEALQQYFFMPDQGFYREQDGSDAYAFAWTARETAAATVSISRISGLGNPYAADVAARFTEIGQYWDANYGAYASSPPPPYGANGDRYFDDNAVIGLEFVRRYRFTGNTDALGLARRVFKFLPHAWDTNQAAAHPGGMHWVDADWNTYQGATNVTGLTSELAAHLYEITGEQDYLDWARRTHDWVREATMLDTGVYANGVQLDGTVEETRWIYNSGSMIGSAALIHRATGDRDMLDQAVADARGALDYWSQGDLLYEQPVIFNAIFFANMLMFDTVSGGKVKEVRDLMSTYAHRLQADNRDEATGLFRFGSGGGGAPDPTNPAKALDQAGAIQILALLAWQSKDYASAA